MTGRGARLAVTCFLAAVAVAGIGLYGTAMLPAARLDASSGFLLVFGALGKLSALTLAAGVTMGFTLRLTPEEPVRFGWLVLAAGLWGFALGQMILVYHQLVLAIPIPFPSIADALFLSGSAALFVALVAFLRAYAAAGFPFEIVRDVLRAGSAGLVLAAVCGWLLLAPLLPIRSWDLATVLGLAYPAADLALLVPAVLLLRVTMRFRGGSVARPWLLLVAGFFLFLASDILFAHLIALDLQSLEPVVDLLYLLSYVALAAAAVAQAHLFDDEHRSRSV